MKRVCFYCKKPIHHGGVDREARSFHKKCYFYYQAKPKRVPKAKVHEIRAKLNSHRLVSGYKLKARKRR